MTKPMFCLIAFAIVLASAVESRCQYGPGYGMSNPVPRENAIQYSLDDARSGDTTPGGVSQPMFAVQSTSGPEDRSPAEAKLSQTPYCGRFHWSCWDYPNVPTKQVLKEKAFWFTVGGDFAISSTDAFVSWYGVNHTPCTEGGAGLPPHPSLGRYFVTNLPENAAVAVVAFVFLKVKGPKWVLPFFLTAPAIVHGRAIATWGQCY